MTGQDDDFYPPQKADQRRDEVIRRMANTPPQHKVKPKSRPQGNKKKTAQARSKPKGRARGKS